MSVVRAYHTAVAETKKLVVTPKPLQVVRLGIDVGERWPHNNPAINIAHYLHMPTVEYVLDQGIVLDERVSIPEARSLGTNRTGWPKLGIMDFMVDGDIEDRFVLYNDGFAGPDADAISYDRILEMFALALDMSEARQVVCTMGSTALHLKRWPKPRISGLHTLF